MEEYEFRRAVRANDIDKVTAMLPMFNPSKALDDAVAFGHSEIVRLLVRDDRISLYPAFKYACMFNKPEIIMIFIKEGGVDPSHNYNGSLFFVAQYGLEKVLKVMLNDSRVDPAAQDNIAIRISAAQGHLECVKMLMKDGRVDVTSRNNEALRMASYGGHTKVVKELLKYPQVDPGAENNSAIGTAARDGHLGVVKLLLKDPRVDPTAEDNYALWSSYGYGYRSIVDMLLSERRVVLTWYGNVCRREKMYCRSRVNEKICKFMVNKIGFDLGMHVIEYVYSYAELIEYNYDVLGMNDYDGEQLEQVVNRGMYTKMTRKRKLIDI